MTRPPPARSPRPHPRSRPGPRRHVALHRGRQCRRGRARRPGTAPRPEGAERAANLFLLTVVHARAYPVFAVMFGYGLVQMAARLRSAGAAPDGDPHRAPAAERGAGRLRVPARAAALFRRFPRRLRPRRDDRHRWPCSAAVSACTGSCCGCGGGRSLYVLALAVQVAWRLASPPARGGLPLRHGRVAGRHGLPDVDARTPGGVAAAHAHGGALHHDRVARHVGGAPAPARRSVDATAASCASWRPAASASPSPAGCPSPSRRRAC